MREDASMTKEISLQSRRWDAVKRNKTTLVGFILTITVIALTLLAPLVLPYDPDEQIGRAHV